MKKILSLGASLMLAVSVFATGNEGVNPPQSGVLTVANGANIITNQFAFPFQQTPLVVVYSSLTNGTPTTNNFVTTTNFAISFPAAGTNSAFAWQAYVGGTKMAYGTTTNAAGTATTVNFPFTYAAAPTVVITPQGGTNSGNVIAVTATTITNFTVLATTVQTNSWISIGQVYNPASEYTGANPPNNKVLTP